MTRITIVSASVGAGHDGVADALAGRLARTGARVSRMDFLDLLPGRIGQRLRDAYAWQLNHAGRTWGWTLAALEHRPLGPFVADLTVRAAQRLTERSLDPFPDIVVSTYPLASQVLGQLRRQGRLPCPVVTYLTDMSVHRLWIAAGVDLHLAIHPEPAGQADRWGVRTCVVRPAIAAAFHPVAPIGEVGAVRQRLGLSPYGPIALVVGGSWGIGRLGQVMAEVEATGVATPVAVCGNNNELRTRLEEAGFHALGWVDDMAPLLRASDIVIQNAGGLTSLQALACRVPVVSYRCLAGHGTTNAAALDRAGYARWIRQPRDLGPGLVDAMRLGAPPLLGRAEPAKLILALARQPALAKEPALATEFALAGA